MARKSKHTCAVPDCGKVFTAQRSNARYCSVKCRNRGWRQVRRRAVPCQQCRRDILTRRTDRKYCSELCRREARIEARRRRRVSRGEKLPPSPRRLRAVRCLDCKSMLEPGEKGICAACVEVDATLSA